MTLQPYECLHAAELLEGHFIKGDYKNENGYCLIGALDRVLGLRVVRIEAGCCIFQDWEIVRFNDDPATTQDDAQLFLLFLGEMAKDSP